MAQLSRERDEALEREKATAEVLRVISASPGELQPVFQAMLTNAVRICEAKFGTLYLREGDAFRAAALHNAPPSFVEFWGGTRLCSQGRVVRRPASIQADHADRAARSLS